MDDLEKSLRDPALLPEGWTAENIGGMHWEVTDPQDRTTRVTTDAESYAGSRREAKVVGRSMGHLNSLSQE